MAKSETAAEQRQKAMTKDERAMQARDLIAKNLHDQNTRDGKRTTYEEAERRAAAIANKVYRENQG